MANVKTILGADVVKFAANQDGFNPVFRKVIDFTETPIASADAYALFRLPVGFVPKLACAYVRKDMAASGTNYDFDLEIGTAADTDSTTITTPLDDIDAAGDLVVASLIKGTAASSSANATTLNPIAITGTTPVYAWLKTDQAVSKGVLEIVVSGDQMVEPSTVL